MNNLIVPRPMMIPAYVERRSIGSSPYANSFFGRPSHIIKLKLNLTGEIPINSSDYFAITVAGVEVYYITGSTLANRLVESSQFEYIIRPNEEIDITYNQADSKLYIQFQFEYYPI